MSVRRIIACFLSLVFCVVSAFAVTQGEEKASASGNTTDPAAATADWVMAEAASSPQLYGEHAALLCADNGQLLLGKNKDERVSPASITKVMTALVVLENCKDLSVQTTVSAKAVNSIEWDSTHISLQAGEVVTLENMMAAMLIQSANDAANVLAEHVGGSLDGFAAMMNQKAQVLGCKNTHFVNAHGLDDAEHYTSAYDMALIGQAVVQYPDFARFAGALEYRMAPTNLCTETRVFYTKQNVLCHNPEEYYYEGAFAGKNGWTTKARQTLITFAKRNGVMLVAVTMQSDSKYNKVLDTIAMFDYGFNNFVPQMVSKQAQVEVAQQVFSDCDVATLKDQMVLLPTGVDADTLTLTPKADGSRALVVKYQGALMQEITVLKAEANAIADVNIEDAATGAKETKGNMFMVVLGGIISGMVLIMGLLVSYRTVRIRRQRRSIRQRRMREQRMQHFQNKK